MNSPLHSALSFSLAIALLLLSAVGASAQKRDASPPQLRRLNAEHAESLGAVARQRNERLRLSRNWYATALDQLLRKATSEGNLDQALALKTERESFHETPLTAEQRKALPASLAPVREKFDAELSKAATDATQQEIPLLKRYVAALTDLQTQITKTGNLDAALTVKEAKSGAEERLAALEAGVPKTVVPQPPTLVPAPARSLPFAAQAIHVADKLEAKRGSENLGPNTVSFDGPPGNGRRGAKGILLKSDPETSRTGNSWTLRYSRGGTAYGLQIIHPTGRGQAIVHLNKDGVGLSAMEAWRDRGYGGGDTKSVRLTNAAEKIFPLVDGREYAIISRMSPGGAHEMFIDGQLVARGRVTRVEPLSLEIAEGQSFPNAGRGNKFEFKGNDLPMKWSVGWAGMIVGPMDEGQNTCRDLRFHAGLVEVPGARQ